MPTNDMTGKKFGKLTVISRDESKPRGHGHPAYWVCQCECGGTTSARTADLRNGHTQSCGCVQKTRTAETNTQNLAGKRYGHLIVIEPTDKRAGRHVIWKCQCDCGNITEVSSNSLNTGHITSCGCSSESTGEFIIQKLLQENNIPFEREKKFEDCIFPDTKSQPRFDFYVNGQYLIEYDGVQHFRPVEFFGGEEAFLDRQKKDAYKTQWCKNHNIPLIRIPYTKLPTLTIENLLLKESKDVSD